jgi:hypothetical protein
MSDLKGWRFANRDLVDDAMDEKEEAEGILPEQEEVETISNEELQKLKLEKVDYYNNL